MLNISKLEMVYACTKTLYFGAFFPHFEKPLPNRIEFYMFYKVQSLKKRNIPQHNRWLFHGTVWGIINGIHYFPEPFFSAFLPINPGFKKDCSNIYAVLLLDSRHKCLIEFCITHTLLLTNMWNVDIVLYFDTCSSLELWLRDVIKEWKALMRFTRYDFKTDFEDRYAWHLFKLTYPTTSYENRKKS